MEGHSELPHFNEKIPYYKVYSSSMHFTFWRVEPGHTDPSEPRYESEGSCYLPLSKLMDLAYSITKEAETNLEYLCREVDLRVKLWLHGRETGEARLRFRFLMQSHLRQMQSCVRTEEGVLASTPVFSYSAGRECEEIGALGKINQEIQTLFIDLEAAAESSNQQEKLKAIVLKINALLQQELRLLRSSQRESTLIYNYSNRDDLMKGQRFLIFFAFKVLSYIREDISYLKDACWQILATILSRGEFQLPHMAFSPEEQAALRLPNPSEPLKFKKDVALKYLELLKELLEETIRSLECKGELAEQIFAEKFCAYAYFRLPLFREQILQTLKEQKDPVIPEWRGMEVDLYAEGHHPSKEDDFYRPLFDWENSFLRPLGQEERYRNFQGEMEKQVMRERWKLRLSKRQMAFCGFLENLLEEIHYVCVVSKYIRWHCLPGYNQLLHAFLAEMRNQPIRRYSEALRSCCVKWLANEKLINVMVVMLLSRANVNDPTTVALTFELIDAFFQRIKALDRPIPGTFDFKFLLKGIRLVLDSEFEASISRVLLFVYNNFGVLTEEFSLELALFLMTRYFYRFFFHWSYDLRYIFQMLVFTKVSRYHRSRDNEAPSQSSTSAYVSSLRLVLRQRYEQLLEEVRDDLDPQATINSNNIDRFHDRDYHKKMRAKLERARLGHRLQSPLSSQKDLGAKPQFLFKVSHKAGEERSFETPKKMLYFKEEEMELETARP
jgi:hypothetical protein